jgi:hypothetical protein
MYSVPARAIKPLLAYLFPVMMVSPSLIWIALDKSVWMWDEAIYGKGSVDLFYTLIHSPERWLRRLNIPQSQAPGVSWLGQFFVPLGYLLGSIDMGLLISIILTQAVTLLLMYRAFRELSDRNEPVVIAGCLACASAPLFVAMSHQYLTEPLQLFAVSWFVLIMSFAPKWNRAFTLSQLLAATPVAMLAKVSSPLYCAGPAVVALWYVFRPASLPRQSAGNRTNLVMIFVAGLLLNIGVIRWYSRNITRVIQHVSVASSGPIAEIYGKNDTVLNTLVYWLEALRNNFFLPSIFVWIGVLCASAMTVHLIKTSVVRKHFTVCALVSLSQLIIVLIVFSFHTNRELKYLLPLLPYVGVVICWTLAQIRFPIVTGLAALFFLAQFASTYGQAFGLLTRAPTTPGWLMVPNSVSSYKESTALDAIIGKTCTDRESQPYLNLVGIEKPWLNEHSANYLAAKHRVLYKPVHCRYGSFGYETDPDKIWNHLLSNVRYYITMDPDSNPVPSEDAHLQAINQNYLPTLKKVQSSIWFELEPALAEDPSIWIFRRKNVSLH